MWAAQWPAVARSFTQQFTSEQFSNFLLTFFPKFSQRESAKNKLLAWCGVRRCSGGAEHLRGDLEAEADEMGGVRNVGGF